MTEPRTAVGLWEENELARQSEVWESGELTLLEKTLAVIRWAAGEFRPRLALACSFGAEDCALVDMLAHQAPDVPAFYLDTGLLFEDTHRTRDRLSERYGSRFIQVLPALTVQEQEVAHGAALWAREPDRCCAMRKVEPLAGMLSGLDCWITGLRRDQAPTRANARLVEWDAKFRLVKCNPLAAWTSEDVWSYIRANEVPYNPMHDQGYPSIGCWPCTRAVRPGEDARAGRWAGFAKTECGLHQG